MTNDNWGFKLKGRDHRTCAARVFLTFDGWNESFNSPVLILLLCFCVLVSSFVLILL